MTAVLQDAAELVLSYLHKKDHPEKRTVQLKDNDFFLTICWIILVQFVFQCLKKFLYGFDNQLLSYDFYKPDHSL